MLDKAEPPIAFEIESRNDYGTLRPDSSGLPLSKFVKMPNPETLDSEAPNPRTPPNPTSRDAKVTNRAPDRRKAGGWKVLQQCDHHPQDKQ